MKNFTAPICLTLAVLLGSTGESVSAEIAVTISNITGEPIAINDKGIGESWYLEGACPLETSSRHIYINVLVGEPVSINQDGLGKAFCITNPSAVKGLDEDTRRILLGPGF